MNIKETGFILFLENYENNVSFYTDKLGLKVREEKMDSQNLILVEVI